MRTLFHTAIGFSGLVAATLVYPAPGAANSSNNSWVTLSGKVKSVAGETFTLETKKGDVMVEMDGWNWPNQKTAVKQGNQVVVSGRADQDFFEKYKVEASSVYDKNLDTFYFASATDEEDYYFIHPPIVDFTRGDWITLSGKATDVKQDQFVLDTGSGKIRVDTSGMTSKPKLSGGDTRVTVLGNMQKADLFGARTLEASALLTHRAPSAKSASGGKWASKGDWIGLSGKVVEANASDFTLDYGPGTVKVSSQDERRWYDIYTDDAVAKLEKGDRVTVYGKITDDTFDSRAIHMDALYRPDTQRYYFTSDNADWTYGFPGLLRDGNDWVRLTGEVVSKDKDALVITSGGKRVNVDVTKVPGELANISKGTRVVVFGPSKDSDIFAQTIEADSVMRMSAIDSDMRTGGMRAER